MLQSKPCHACFSFYTATTHKMSHAQVGTEKGQIFSLLVLLSDAWVLTPEGHILEDLGLAALSLREMKKGKCPLIKHSL